MSKIYQKISDDEYKEITTESKNIRLSDLEGEKADWELVKTLTIRQLRFAAELIANGTKADTEINKLSTKIDSLNVLKAQGGKL